MNSARKAQREVEGMEGGREKERKIERERERESKTQGGRERYRQDLIIGFLA